MGTGDERGERTGRRVIGANLSQIHWLEGNGREHVGRCGNFVVLAPYGPPSVASPARFARWLEEVATEGGPAPALLVAFPPFLVLPSEEARPMLRDTVARIEPLLSAVSVVVPGQGFFAAAQCAAATAVFVFAGLRNHKVHPSLNDGVAWLRPWLSPVLDLGSLAGQVQARLDGDGAREAEASGSGR